MFIHVNLYNKMNCSVFEHLQIVLDMSKADVCVFLTSVAIFPLFSLIKR